MKDLQNKELEDALTIIKNDNRVNGMYAGLGQFTQGYDAAIERVINILENLLPTKEANEK